MNTKRKHQVIAEWVIVLAMLSLAVPIRLTADETTASAVASEIASTSHTSEIATKPVSKVPYLQPPVDMVSSPTISRGIQTVPLRPEMLQSKPLKLSVPQAKRDDLANGIKFFHYSSHDLPSIYFTLIINAGSVLDPAEKVGLSDIVAGTLRAGGTTGKSGDEIDKELEQIGSSLSINAERDLVRVQMFALAENRDKALALLSDILLHPAFDEKKLRQQKDLKIEEIRRENDEPADISRREYRKLIYGSDHPLARTPNDAGVNSINRADVRKFYEDYYRPSSVWFGVSGDISKDDAKKEAEQSFGAWNKPAAEIAKIAEPNAQHDGSTSGVTFIRKETAQSQIRMGHLGLPRHSPMQYAAAVFNNIYGAGGFSSRLMQEVRTRKGYVYGVGGAVLSDTPRGLFYAAAASKAKTTGAAIGEMLNVTNEIIDGKFSEAEIETARRDAIYSFITSFDMPQEIVYNTMYYSYLGYPDDYLSQYIPHMQAVTKDDVTSVARQLIHPERMKILVVGDDKAFDMPLSKFGPVKEIRLEKPAVGEAKTEE